MRVIFLITGACALLLGVCHQTAFRGCTVHELIHLKGGLRDYGLCKDWNCKNNTRECYFNGSTQKKIEGKDVDVKSCDLDVSEGCFCDFTGPNAVCRITRYGCNKDCSECSFIEEDSAPLNCNNSPDPE